MPLRIAISQIGDSNRINISLMRKAARLVLAEEGVQTSNINLAFVSDKHSAQINLQYLEHSGPTDVITFPYSQRNAETLDGELIIGVEVGKRVANERGHDLQAELALYVIHGLLHLCGYDDKKKAARAKMRQRERHYLKRLGLPPIAEAD